MDGLEGNTDAARSAYLGRRFTKDPSIVSRNIAGEFILVPLRRKVADVESIYTMNEVGGRIWELVDGERSVGEILGMVIEEFEVQPAEAEADVVGFLRQLEKVQAVKEV